MAVLMREGIALLEENRNIAVFRAFQTEVKLLWYQKQGLVVGKLKYAVLSQTKCILSSVWSYS